MSLTESTWFEAKLLFSYFHQQGSLLGTSASLLVTSALLVVTRTIVVTRTCFHVFSMVWWQEVQEHPQTYVVW